MGEHTLLSVLSATSSVHFAYADVGTYGLAHSLLAWARCRLWADRNGVRMLAPNWFHLRHRIGPMLRGEHDNRHYHRLFKFNSSYVTGLRRLQILATTPRVAAESTDLEVVTNSTQPQLVVFTNRMRLNEETHFAEIVGFGDAMRIDLCAMTKPVYRPSPYITPHIAVHVRMGDFGASVSLDSLRQGSKNSRIPIGWYVDMVNALRLEFGDTPVRVYSDGTDEALAPLLRLPATTRSPKQPSITDLLGMAQARLLISSGSGFSMWGAYLGNSPRICFPGQRFCRVLPEGLDFDLEPECERPSELSVRFLAHVRNRLIA